MCLQASKHRLFNMQIDWILIDSRRNGSYVLNTSAIALETFEMHLSEAYILPDSNVFLFIDTASGWEIWEGFKVGKMERIRVNRHGIVTRDEIYFDKNDSISFKSNLRGITLKATTVVSRYYDIIFSMLGKHVYHNKLKCID